MDISTPDRATSGTIARPPHTFSGSVLPFDLHSEVESLRREMSQRSETRFSKTLIRESDFSLVLIALEQGSTIQEHTAPGEVVVQAVSGRVRLVAGESFDLAAGQLLALAPGVALHLEALEPSAVLLTVARSAVPVIANLAHTATDAAVEGKA